MTNSRTELPTRRAVDESSAPLGDRMTYPEAQAYVMREEVRAELLDVRIDEWAVWPLIRPDLVTRLVGARFASSASARRSRWHTMARRIVAGIPDAVAYGRLERAERVFNTHTSSLTYPVDGGFGDSYMHEIIEALPGSTVLETANDDLLAQRRPSRGARYVTSAGLEIATAIGSRVLGRREVERQASALSERVSGAFGRGIFEADEICAILAHFLWSKRVHAALFRRIRPRQVVMIDWSGQGAIAAAKESGAEVFDMQHGVLNEQVYLWPDAAAPARARMPVADRLLMFGDFWTAQLAGAFWQGRLHAVGSVPIDRARARGLASSSRGTPTLLFTAQGIEPERTAVFLRDFVLLAPAGTRLTIKLHPIYSGDRETFASVLRGLPGVRIVGHDDGLSSLDLISAATLHASISSTSHFDAIALDRPTVILPFQTWENVATLYRSGHAAVAESPADLLRMLREPSPISCMPDVADYYYTRGAVQNVVRALRDI